MRRAIDAPLLMGAGVLGLMVLAAASSPSARRAAQEAEQKVEHLITDWIPALIARTSAHEGHYWSVQRNLDGNGVSYGILQWTQKSGSLGKLLRAMAAADPAAFVRLFGPSWSRVLEVTGRASLEAVDGAVLWSEPWVSRFVAAGRWPAFQAAQVQLAGASEYRAAAVDIGRILGVATERAMAVYFDRAVQQGATGARKSAERLAAWYAEDPRRRPTVPTDVVAQYAWMCASRFRRTTPPEHRSFNPAGNIWWGAVSTELSELGPGRYRSTRVPVSGVWHALTGPSDKPWSLYDLIVGRASGILVDSKLRDLPVALGKLAAA